MNIKIGKFILETLTTGMYESPKDIYREYIQNAVDSIDSAVNDGILKHDEGIVDICIDKKARIIEIKDNGTGVKFADSERFLLNIGDSIKLNTGSRGFRGIGRLAGLAYCSELTFITSYRGEDTRTIIVFNAKKLKKNLFSMEYIGSLEEVFTSIISVTKEHEIKSKHYFTVLLSGVEDIDNILDVNEINNYLSQVAPVPFHLSGRI